MKLLNILRTDRERPAGVDHLAIDKDIMNEGTPPLRSFGSPGSLAETQGPHAASIPPLQRFSLPSGARPLDGYTIKRGVGAGGFGEVYYAVTDAGKDVAIKRIQRNLDIELRGVRQCLNLKHPNLLSLFDIRYDDDGQAWVIMEYVSGENLQAAIERYRHGMPQETVRAWFDGIAAGVGYLHECGIVHRDLKPGNIFLDQHTVKIGDYGLSKFISCSRRSGQTQSVGTFHYMAPEIGQGRYGKEIDIYALGIILFEMLTGHVPYDGESSQEIIMKHLTAAPPVQQLASPYREVIARALAKDPGSRFHDVSDMRAMLLGDTPPDVSASVFRSPFVPSPSADPPVSSLGDMAGSAQPRPSSEPTAPATPTEAVIKAASAVWTEVLRIWRQLSPFWQAAFLFAMVVTLFINNKRILPTAIVVAMAVMIFHQLRNKETRLRRKREDAEKVDRDPSVSKPEKEPSHVRRAKAQAEKIAAHRKIRTALSQKTQGQRGTELLGGFLIAALVASAMGLAACLLVLQATGAHRFQLVPNFVWITVTSTLATWGVLVLSKHWEGSAENQGLRRFPMLILGFLVGGAAFALSEFLKFQPAGLIPFEEEVISSHFHASNGMPLIGAYLAYFGALFFIVRWWLHADPARTHRVSMIPILMATALGLALDALCPVPQAFLVAATTALAVQIAAPWLSQEKRQELQLGNESIG